MKVGISLFLLRPERMPEVAVRAEALGFESVWVPEHLVFPAEIHSRYPYSGSGVAPINPSTPLVDPLILLSFIAARTNRIRVGTNVYILPLRHPIEAARLAVTLDVLSQGRLSLGVGAGWLAEEFQAVGIDFESRGARLRECVRVLKRLWTEPTPAFEGRFFSFAPVKFEPKPVQKPHPPILFGGESEAALKRAAALGDGWYGVGHTPASAAAQVIRLRGLLEAAGRTAEPFEITVSCTSQSFAPQDLDEYAAAGVHRVVILPWRRSREAVEAMTALAERLGLAGG